MRTPGQSLGLRRRVGGGGATLLPIASGGMKPRAPRQPWTLAGFIEGGSAKIRVAPGMVNNFVPIIGGTSIAAATPPALTVTGSSGIIYLKATVDAAGAITALVIQNAGSVPADTATEKHKLIGTWTSSGGVFTSVTSILNANQTLYLCNGTAIWEA